MTLYIFIGALAGAVFSSVYFYKQLRAHQPIPVRVNARTR